MSTVYIVQEPHRWDHQRQELVKTFDVTPAEEFGDLEYLLGPNAAPWDLSSDGSVMRQLHDGLQYITEDDYLLLIGSPALISAVTAVALEYLPNKRFRMLQWNGKARKYTAIDAETRKGE